MFNILPWMEEAKLRELSAGMTEAKADAAVIRLTTSLPFVVCPSRRSPGLFPVTTRFEYWVVAVPTSVKRSPAAVARSDYAANMGSSARPVNCLGGVSFSPASYADRMTDARWQSNFGPPTDGFMFRRSQIRFKDVTDGSSHTYLVGEKYVDPQLPAATGSLGPLCVWRES